MKLQSAFILLLLLAGAVSATASTFADLPASGYHPGDNQLDNVTSTQGAQVGYTITVNSAHGTVTLDPNKPTYDYGDVVTLSAVASPGWLFVYWSGGVVGSDNPIQVTINGSMNIAANYIQIDYTLTVVASHGTVIVDPDKATYHYGDVVTLTAIPAPGWVFTGWLGGLAGTSNPGSLIIHDNTVVTAKFEKVSTATPVPTKTMIFPGRSSPTSTLTIQPSASPTNMRVTLAKSPTPIIPPTFTPTATLAAFVWPSSTPVIPKYLPEIREGNFKAQLVLVIVLGISVVGIVAWSVRNKRWHPG
jgi:uncharacterized repeat protein (TIGR02543 family)